MQQLVQQPSNNTAQLPARTLIIFSLLNIPLAGALMPIYAYLPQFYAQQLGAGLAVIGTLFMASRIWNAALDPLVGVWSDRTRSRWGRRKPWIASGGIIFLIASYALFVRSAAPVDTVYLGFWLFTFYLGWTMATIPLAAWSGELSSRYHERSRVQTYVQTFSALGLLLVLLIPAGLDWIGRHELQEKIAAMGWFMVITLLPALAAGLWWVRENDVPPQQEWVAPRKALGAVAALRILITDKLLLRVMASDFTVNLGQGLRGSLFLFFVAGCAGLPQWASSLWLLQFVFGVFAGPIWLRLSYRLGKHRTAVAGELAQVAINLCLLLVGFGDWQLLLALTVAQGLAQGSGNLMLRAMVADVADLQKLQTGEERAGLLFSIFNMTGSLAMAMAVAVAFAAVGWFGFMPGGNNDATAMHGLQLVFALGPALSHLISALLVWNFPLDQQRHAQIRSALTAAQSAP
jgi:glycoside/pentoside/hexuronide:cation symporter, GPH family